MTPLHK